MDENILWVKPKEGTPNSNHVGPLCRCPKLLLKLLLFLVIVLFMLKVYVSGYFHSQFSMESTVDDGINMNESTSEIQKVYINQFIVNDEEKVDIGYTDGNKSFMSTCQVQNNIVFIKTAKTGGSTMSTIIYRYGLKHDLVAAVDPGRNSLIQEDDTGKHYIIEEYHCNGFPGYNIMASHIFYNRPAMEEVVKHAKYVTIIRSPYTRLKSSFYFSGKDKFYANALNPLEDYLIEKYDTFILHNSNPNTGFKAYVTRFRLLSSGNPTTLSSEIQQLDKELDLVMLTEYYDESLILLKKLMCWDFDDIVYVRMKAHSTYQPPITPRMAEMIKEMSSLDIEFYGYFNNTFWEKVRNYDGDFAADLAKFRSLQKEVNARCENDTDSDYCELLHTDANRMSAKVAKSDSKWIC
ncbi:galactosylceramide sulfotransferase-like [Glandiceps talaboti]